MIKNNSITKKTYNLIFPQCVSVNKFLALKTITLYIPFDIIDCGFFFLGWVGELLEVILETI